MKYLVILFLPLRKNSHELCVKACNASQNFFHGFFRTHYAKSAGKKVFEISLEHLNYFMILIYVFIS